MHQKFHSLNDLGVSYLKQISVQSGRHAKMHCFAGVHSVMDNENSNALTKKIFDLEVYS